MIHLHQSTIRLRVVASVTAASSFIFSINSLAENLPLWELGVGSSFLSTNDYRGSNHRSTFAFPIPYFTYRGEHLHIDRRGLRGILVDQNQFRLNISLSGSIPASSSDNPMRDRMPDLKPTIEIGPSLEFTIYKQGDYRARLELPLRAVYAIDLQGTDPAGWISYPHINLDMPERYNSWNLSLNIGPLLGEKRYHQYFYGVDEPYKTPTRPLFNASGGYSGASVIFNAVRHHKQYWFGAFLRYDSLEGASFEESPLLERKNYIMAGFAFAWIFKHSKKSIPR